MTRQKYCKNETNNKPSIETELNKQSKLLTSYRHSLKLLALQVSALHHEIRQRDVLLHNIKTSHSWKITLPVRILKYIVTGQARQKYPLNTIRKRLLQIYKEDGYLGVYSKLMLRFPVLFTFKKRIQSFYKKNNIPTENNNNVISVSQTNNYLDNLDIISGYQFSSPLDYPNNPLILIIAEVTLPQCYKYRVQQKAEHLERLGWTVKIVDWREQKTALSFLQICKEVIFYRVPAFPNVVEQIKEAKRLSLSPWWEVDDLIVDQELYAECGFIEHMSKEEKDLLFFGADLFRKTMLSCDRAIASTHALAEVMYQAGVPETRVIENALDKDTLRIASRFYPAKTKITKQDKKSDQAIIVYGSGTNTHNADFLIASAGILSALQQEPTLHLWIVGELDLPVEFQSVINQVRYVPPQSYEQYLELLSQADIAIAPLEPILFNDAKSNIKYLEASILGIPSVCSPRQAFREVIRDRENGLLANTSNEWKEQLLFLATNADLRKKIGQQAYHDVLSHYSPEVITTEQVEPIFGRPQTVTSQKKKLKILVVNIHYDPYSFGGATFVAEEMARRIHEKDDVEVSVFTSRPIRGEERGLCRYESHGSVVYSVDLPPLVYVTQQFDNIEILEPFEMVLDTVKPDIVHFHAVQNMGLQMLFVCQGRHIPYVITLHDSWWLCNRQFMVKSDGKYCFQNKIDLKVCQRCEMHVGHLTERMVMMMNAMQAASLLLSPSETHRQLYIANNIDKSLIQVNHNGIMRPKKNRPTRRKNLPVRFGFVAGDELIKGFGVIKSVFKSLSRSDWELKIIDSKVNMGHAPIDISSWGAKGKVITVPPYDDKDKDNFFYGIDVLLFPSQWKESYGMTVREALLRDVWVICSHPGGQSEDVIDGVNGSYISLTGDEEELRKVVENLLDNSKMFDSYVNPHKDHIATLEGQAEELLSYYRQIIEK